MIVEPVSPVKKSSLYADLLERQEAAFKAGFYYESCWFAHAIFEDRTRSIVSNSADGTGYGGKISDKITQILDRLDATKAKVVDGKPIKDKRTGNKIRVPKWPRLHTVERSLIEALQSWTKDRNDLVHDLASGNLSLEDADATSLELAESGLVLARELCSAARRVKKYSSSV